MIPVPHPLYLTQPLLIKERRSFTLSFSLRRGRSYKSGMTSLVWGDIL
ncbi:MAG: hypothetical protein LBQ59_05300 [Candidatus Peribacteria bacterium]|nr:hypothetical protein [Candidatus Peribacteria bacterium]